MYSYEDRMRAVALYIKLDKRVRATLRILGYPTKNSLKAWFRELETHHQLKVACAPRKPKYTEEQMRAAVDYYFDNDFCMSATIRALGYSGRDSFHKWIDTNSHRRPSANRPTHASVQTCHRSRIAQPTRECRCTCRKT
jgi:putative transposase